MMVLYQSLIRNLFRSLYNLSVSVLLLSASAKARKCQQEGPTAALAIGIPGIPRGGNRIPGIPGPRGGKAKFQHHSPRRAMRATSGGPSPQTLLPTGCYPALGRDPRPRGRFTHRAPSSGGFHIFQLSPTSSAALSQGRPRLCPASPLPALPLGSWGCFDSSKQ